MFATDDVVIDPAQSWDHDRKKENTRSHNCPIWARLSGWAGTESALCLIMGVHEAERYLQHKPQKGFIGLQEYARNKNKDSFVLSALVRAFKIPMDDRKHKLFKPETLDELCAKHWPDDRFISLARAREMVRKAEYLPKCAFELAGIRFYDKEECKEAHKEVLRRLIESRSLNATLRHAGSRKLREERRQADQALKIKTHLQRKAIQKSTLPPEVMPDGFMYLTKAAKSCGIHKNTLFRAYHAGKIEGKIQRFKTILKIADIEKFIEWHNMPSMEKLRPEPVPDGFMYLADAVAKYGIHTSTLHRYYKRGIVRGRPFQLKTIVNIEDIERVKRDGLQAVVMGPPKPKYMSNPLPEAPKGYIDTNKALAISCKGYSALYKAMRREKFKSITIRRIKFIEESSFRHWLSLQPELL